MLRIYVLPIKQYMELGQFDVCITIAFHRSQLMHIQMNLSLGELSGIYLI